MVQKKVLHVVGARPNFMKVAPVLRALSKIKKFKQILVHTGQHYDANMSGVFFRQLGIPKPDYDLGVGSGTHTAQTAEIMIRFEKVLIREKPDLVVVYGDVNSTVAAALVASKNGIRTAHVEAGLRSGDRTMPEEINRIITDHICDYLFTPSPDGGQNLKREGIPGKKIFFCGNVMIDTLARLLPRIGPPRLPELQKRYILVTLHRPSNVDDPARLKKILKALVRLSKKAQIVFPVHPRTQKKINDLRLPVSDKVLFLEPQGYLEFLGLTRGAWAVVTDSGGIQEEASYLSVPCFTLRENTERPVTITHGSNRLVKKLEQLEGLLNAKKLEGPRRKFRLQYWDGKAAQRIAGFISRNA